MTKALFAIPLFLLWLAVVPLILRPFGVRIPHGPLDFRGCRDALQSLNFPHYVAIYGVLYFGCGMLIMTTFSRYVGWKYFHASSNGLSEKEWFDRVLQWPLLSGVLFGSLSWVVGSHRNPKGDSPQ